MTPQPINIQPMLYFRSPWESENLVTIEVSKYQQYALFGNDAHDHADELLDYYLSMEQFTCCDMCVNLEIWSGEKSWTNYSCDHFGDMGYWVSLLATLKQDKENLKTLFSYGDQAFGGAIEKQKDLILLHEVTSFERFYNDEFDWSIEPIIITEPKFRTLKTE